MFSRVTQVKFLDLRPDKSLRKDLDRAYKRVMNSGNFILGEEARLLEEEFVGYIGDKNRYGVCVNSGFDGLALSLKCLGVKRGDEVIVPANAPIPVWMAVTNVCAIPVPADVSDTYNTNVGYINDQITDKTKCVIFVHLFGRPVDDILTMCTTLRENGIGVIEDCSQAHGSTFGVYPYGMVGSVGDLAVFSFYPTKNMGGYGDGGIIITSSEEFYNMARKMREYGGGEYSGINSRIDSLQAAFLRERLYVLDDYNSIRVDNAKYYTKNLHGVDGLIVPKYHKGHIWHQFVVRHEKRDKFREYLEKNGIETMIHYPVIPEETLYYSRCEYYSPNARQFAKEVFSLPIGPHLTINHLDYIARKMQEF